MEDAFGMTLQRPRSLLPSTDSHKVHDGWDRHETRREPHFPWLSRIPCITGHLKCGLLLRARRLGFENGCFSAFLEHRPCASPPQPEDSCSHLLGSSPTEHTICPRQRQGRPRGWGAAAHRAPRHTLGPSLGWVNPVSCRSMWKVGLSQDEG